MRIFATGGAAGSDAGSFLGFIDMMFPFCLRFQAGIIASLGRPTPRSSRAVTAENAKDRLPFFRPLFRFEKSNDLFRKAQAGSLLDRIQAGAPWQRDIGLGWQIRSAPERRNRTVVNR